MKKKYIAPTIEILIIESKSSLLAGSAFGTNIQSEDADANEPTLSPTLYDWGKEWY